jgi:hypothetical protein
VSGGPIHGPHQGGGWRQQEVRKATRDPDGAALHMFPKRGAHLIPPSSSTGSSTDCGLLKSFTLPQMPGASALESCPEAPGKRGTLARRAAGHAPSIALSLRFRTRPNRLRKVHG